MKKKANTVTIVGLGATGLSCIKFLSQFDDPLAVTDTRKTPPGLAECKSSKLPVDYYLGGISESILMQSQLIVLSPGLSPELPVFAKCREREIPIIGDIELFARHQTAPLIAITGTNGKSTVTTLVGMLLKAAGHRVEVGGNLGVPALDLLAKPIPDYFVLELSSFQLKLTTSLKAHIACLLNISPDHLDAHMDMADYISSKKRIYQNCDFAIYNRADQETYPPQNISSFSFGLSNPTNHQFGIHTVGQEVNLAFEQLNLLKTEEMKLVGHHNWQNALAALAIVKACGVNLPLVLPQLKQFTGLPHRCQWITEIDGVAWYNDSKGTNVGASCAALEGLGITLKGKIVLIAGGLGKGASFDALSQAAKRFVRQVILFGQDAKQIANALEGHVPYQYALNLEQAVNQAKSVAEPRDAVLLSPACASYDCFKNFEDRGNQFTQFVKKLERNKKQ